MMRASYRLIVLLALIVGALAPVTSAEAALVPVARLAPAVGQGPGPLENIAVSGTTAVAGSEGTTAYIFVEPPGGWTNMGASAILSDSNANGFGPVAISGRTAVVNARGGEDVFVEPPGGWAGSLQPAATLSASDGDHFGPPAIDGQTIVALGTNAQTGIGSLYVFQEPTGGWPGSLHEVAKLSDSHGYGLSYPAIHGGYVFGSQLTGVDVFSRPARGWGGASHERAILAGAPNAGLAPLAVSGPSVQARKYVFGKPKRGWAGIVRPSAVLDPLLPGNAAQYFFATSANSDQAIALTAAQFSQRACPCLGDIWVFTKPAGGWTGSIPARVATAYESTVGPEEIALQGLNLFTDGGDSVQIYRIVGSPTAALAVTGLDTAKPRIELQVKAGANSPKITALRIALAPGLKFAGKRAVRSAIRTSAGVALRLNRGWAVLRLNHPADELTVQVGPAGLQEGSSLLARALQVHRYNASHQSKRYLNVKLSLNVADVAGHRNSLAASSLFP
jgi:hypothetical protein